MSIRRLPLGEPGDIAGVSSSRAEGIDWRAIPNEDEQYCFSTAAMPLAVSVKGVALEGTGESFILEWGALDFRRAPDRVPRSKVF